MHLECLLSGLSVFDMLSLACSSNACQAALRPPVLDLNIDRGFILRALQSLWRLGCLGNLRHANLTATSAGSVQGAYLGLFDCCPALLQLVLVFTFDHDLLNQYFPKHEGLYPQGSEYKQAHLDALEVLACAMPIRVQRTLRVQECESYVCMYLEIGEQPPQGRCDCCDIDWHWDAGRVAITDRNSAFSWGGSCQLDWTYRWWT